MCCASLAENKNSAVYKGRFAQNIYKEHLQRTFAQKIWKTIAVLCTEQLFAFSSIEAVLPCLCHVSWSQLLYITIFLEYEVIFWAITAVRTVSVEKIVTTQNLFPAKLLKHLFIFQVSFWAHRYNRVDWVCSGNLTSAKELERISPHIHLLKNSFDCWAKTK